jgi:phosphate transport system substrate-binding protein
MGPMKRTLRVRVMALAFLLPVLLLSGCSANSGQSKTELTVTGSTTILPIAEVAAEMFHAQHADLSVLVSGVGSSAGIESVTKGTSDIGTSSRELTPQELTLGLVDTPVAFDAIAVIVNPANPVKALTQKQAADIFEGKVTNWNQVGGPDEPIGLVNRDEASGTRDAFSKIVLAGAAFDSRAAVLPGTGQVRAVVADSVTAVGYISLGFVDKSVKAVSIEGIQPTEKTVADGTYPVSRVLHFFTKGKPSGLAKQYIDFVLSSTIQDKVVRDAGFLPIAEGRK